MIDDLEREKEIVNEKADDLRKHYMKLADSAIPVEIIDGTDEYIAVLEKALELACRGETVLRRRLGQLMAEAL